MSKPVKSDGEQQKALLDKVQTTIMPQSVMDLLLVPSNLKVCNKVTLEAIQASYKAQFTSINSEVQKFIDVRAKQGQRTKAVPVAPPFLQPDPIEVQVKAEPVKEQSFESYYRSMNVTNV